jgi:hypothetical protein
LVVNWGYEEDETNVPRLWMTVLNDGRQPVTIREAGFYGSEFPIQIKKQDTGQLLRGTAQYHYKVIREPTFLDPGVMTRENSPVPDSVEHGYHVDFPLRTYARDARGRVTWGRAAPVVRMMWGERPTRPKVVPPLQWYEVQPPLRPARVEPRWKLWARRELRLGEPGRPSADQLRVRAGLADPAETEERA